jgi:hypothetical protein
VNRQISEPALPSFGALLNAVTTFPDAGWRPIGAAAW